MQVDFPSTALFALAATLSLLLTACLSHATLTPKYNTAKTLLVWCAFLGIHFALALFGYSLDVTDDTLALMGIMLVSPFPVLLLYSECTSAKIFVPIMGSLISNVMTFFFCGTTLSFLDNTPNPYNVHTLLLFNGIKIFWFIVMFVVYRLYLRKIVQQVVKVLGVQIKRYVPIPIFTFVAFFIINRITNALGVMPAIPETRVVFIVFYLVVCSIFVVLYWEIFSTALWSSRALKTEAELNIASNIQRDMLPNIFPPFPERTEFDIYATMQPAKLVGGDFYDFFLVDHDHLAMVMADVSGKGVPAALFMVIAKTLIKNIAQAGLSPKEVLEKANNQLCENNEAEMFVTVWLGILDLTTGKLTYANAGHEYPAIRRASGDYELIREKHGFVLAGLENARYKEYELMLEPGDRLYLYTDGVAEATDAHDQLYGTDRMIETLNQGKDLSCADLLHSIKKDIDRFVGVAPQFDDITMLSFEMRAQS